MELLKQIFKKRKPLSPKVIFRNPEAKRLINLWLGVEKSLTEGSFSIALGSMGFNSEETVVLNNYNSEDSSMAYTTAGKDKTVINSGRFKVLSFPDPTVSYIDILHTITAIDKNIDKTYEYKRHRLASLYLKNYTIKNNPTGLSLTRNFNEKEYRSSLNNEKYKLSITIRIKIQPDTHISLPIKMEPFKLKNEELVEKYLLSLSAPINLIEVYEKIREMSLDNMADYDSIEFKIQSQNNNKLQTTDLIRLDNNRLTCYRGNWNGKDVFVDQAGNCSIKSDNLAILKRGDETVNLNVKASSLEEILKFRLSEEQIKEIEDDLQEVESLVKKKVLRS